MNTLRIVLLFLSWLLVLAVLLPLVKNDYWIFRILEYPRLQKFILALLVLTVFLLVIDYKSRFAIISMVSLGLCIIYLGTKIWPYTLFAQKEMKGIAGTNKDNQVKIFTANVYQYNTEFEKMLAQIRQYKPDLIFLLEADSAWAKAMDTLKAEYPHTLTEPLENTYGLLFYSRFKLKEGAVKYLVEKDVPSLEATIELPSGQLVKAWGLHPKPPVPGEDDRSTAKDKEIMKVAFKAKAEKLPVIVMGDLNDVAWSYVTELFTKTSGLIDPRRGRGFYSTFSASHWYMRFPLDYVFCSAHFGLVDMQRMPHNGSDHFAMFSHFEYIPVLEKVQEKPAADTAEIKEAAEKATQPVK